MTYQKVCFNILSPQLICVKYSILNSFMKSINNTISTSKIATSDDTIEIL